MNFSIRLFLFLFSLFFTLSLFAQDDNKYEDIFYLKNKITIYGELLEIKNDTFFLQLKNGNKSYLKKENVKDIYQSSDKKVINNTESTISKPNILNFEDKDFFQISGYLGFGQGAYTNDIIFNSLALELKYLRRYHLHHFFTTSYGIEVTELHSESLFHTILIGHESILFPKLNTPFINFNFGYSLAHNVCDCLLRSKGGLRYGLGVGMLFNVGGKSILKTGLSYLVQHSQELSTTFLQDDWFYKNPRLVFTTGIMF